MVQTVNCYLDSNCKRRHYNNATILPHSEKLISQKNIPSDNYVEAAKLKSKKKCCVKLQPLDATVEHDVDLKATERKFSHRLNPLPTKQLGAPDQKKLCSKIPVLQRKILPSKKQNTNNIQCDTGLSAADRRQKFHQSRLHAVGICPTDLSSVKKQLNPIQYDLFPCYEGYIVHKYFVPSAPGGNLKSILPPIKPLEIIPSAVQKSNRPKAKCLLGEITHFPALCNPSSSKRKKKYTSTVPHLPPILPPPAAPPPSISTSLEKNVSQVKEEISGSKNNEDWNLSNFAFYKLAIT